MPKVKSDAYLFSKVSFRQFGSVRTEHAHKLCQHIEANYDIVCCHDPIEGTNFSDVSSLNKIRMTLDAYGKVRAFVKGFVCGYHA